MKPAAAEAKKAQAMQAVADQVARSNELIADLTTKVNILVALLTPKAPEEPTEANANAEAPEEPEAKPKGNRRS